MEKTHRLGLQTVRQMKKSLSALFLIMVTTFLGFSSGKALNRQYSILTTARFVREKTVQQCKNPSDSVFLRRSVSAHPFMSISVSFSGVILGNPWLPLISCPDHSVGGGYSKWLICFCLSLIIYYSFFSCMSMIQNQVFSILLFAQKPGSRVVQNVQKFGGKNIQRQPVAKRRVALFVGGAPMKRHLDFHGVPFKGVRVRRFEVLTVPPKEDIFFGKSCAFGGFF